MEAARLAAALALSQQSAALIFEQRHTERSELLGLLVATEAARVTAAAASAAASAPATGHTTAPSSATSAELDDSNVGVNPSEYGDNDHTGGSHTYRSADDVYPQDARGIGRGTNGSNHRGLFFYDAEAAREAAMTTLGGAVDAATQGLRDELGAVQAWVGGWMGSVICFDYSRRA